MIILATILSWLVALFVSLELASSIFESAGDLFPAILILSLAATVCWGYLAIQQSNDRRWRIINCVIQLVIASSHLFAILTWFN